MPLHSLLVGIPPLNSTQKKDNPAGTIYCKFTSWTQPNFRSLIGCCGWPLLKGCTGLYQVVGMIEGLMVLLYTTGGAMGSSLGGKGQQLRKQVRYLTVPTLCGRWTDDAALDRVLSIYQIDNCGPSWYNGSRVILKPRVQHDFFGSVLLIDGFPRLITSTTLNNVWNFNQLISYVRK
jgi:hypothetical protein